MSYLQKFKDNSAAQKVHHHLKIAFNKKLLLALLIVLAIPLTVYLSMQTQDIENHAATPTGLESRGYIIEFKEPPLIDGRISGAGSVGISSGRPTENRRIDIEAQHVAAKKNLLSILGRNDYVSDAASAGEVKVLGEYENGINGIALDISKAQAEKLLAESPYVKAVYPNLVVEATLKDSVPMMSANKVWALKDSKGASVNGKDINVAVIDTGVDYRHPDLGESASEQKFNSKVIGGYDFINDDDDPMDDVGHGTHVAGIIAGNGTLKGVAPGANIIAYKVLDEGGRGTFADILNGIEAAIETRNDDNPNNDVSIINLSLSARCNGVYSVNCGPDDVLSREVDKATARGIVVVAAAGNTSGQAPAGSISSPGAARTAITVGSVNKLKQMSKFSNRGPIALADETIVKPDVVAPGEGIPSSDPSDPNTGICSAKLSSLGGLTCYDGNHRPLSGTSMAAPHVAGIVALLRQKNPQTSALNLKDMIRQKAVSLGLDQNTQGKGFVDASKLFDLTAPPPSETPTPPVPENKFMTITALQDSYVAQKQPNTNFGSSKKLKIDGSPKEITYLMFDLTPLAGKKIVSANLLLQIPKANGSGSSNTFSLRIVDPNSWTQRSIKYKNKPALGNLTATFKGKGIGNLIQVSIRDAVMAALGQKIGFAITSDGANELILNSANASSNKPRLLIEYQ